MSSDFKFDDSFHGKHKKRRIEKINKNKIKVIEEYEYEYASFFDRFIATLIDTFIFIFVIYGLLYLFFGVGIFLSESDSSPISTLEGDPLITYIFINNIFPIIAIIWFWMKYKGTPGKIAMGIQIIDEKNGDSLSLGKSIIRYFGYIISSIPLCLGYFWIFIDKKNRAWHDIFAGSIVIKEQK